MLVRGLKKSRSRKAKRPTTEQKIRMLWEANGGEIIVHQSKPKTNTPPRPVFGTR